MHVFELPFRTFWLDALNRDRVACRTALAVADGDRHRHRPRGIRAGEDRLAFCRIRERAVWRTPLIGQRVAIRVLRVCGHRGGLANFDDARFAAGLHGWRTVRRSRWRRWWWRWWRR